MTTFDERENAYEAKFAHDEELRFKAKSRSDKALGAWAAIQLGLNGAAAEHYAKEAVRSDFKLPGEHGIIGKILADFKAKGVAINEVQLRKKLFDLLAQAVAEIEAGK